MRTICSVPGCWRLTVYRDRCEVHPWRPMTRDWRRARAAVRKRDGGRCVDCGAPASAVHHLNPVDLGGAHTEANMVALCASCHRLRESA